MLFQEHMLRIFSGLLSNSPGLQGQIIDIKCQKNCNKSAILIFFQSLLNLSENWSLVTCITNLERIHKKNFRLSCPQGKIIEVNAKNHNKSAIFFFSHFQTCLRTGH